MHLLKFLSEWLSFFPLRSFWTTELLPHFFRGLGFGQSSSLLPGLVRILNLTLECPSPYCSWLSSFPFLSADSSLKSKCYVICGFLSMCPITPISLFANSWEIRFLVFSQIMLLEFFLANQFQVVPKYLFLKVWSLVLSDFENIARLFFFRIVCCVSFFIEIISICHLTTKGLKNMKIKKNILH